MHLASSSSVPEVRIALRNFVFNKLLEARTLLPKHVEVGT